MLSKRQLLAGFAFAAVLTFSPFAQATEKKPFDAAAFAAAQNAGRPILVDVTAPWCPTCKAQASILSKLASDPKFKNLAIFEVDFDSKKDVLRSFNVRQQSTLIVFRGKQETGRSTGDTNPASIEVLLNKAI
jgi:thiol-disulfide isomerase/thioredoxin